ncbi:hypothetical protein [Haladaptatus caseinilyticus]|uniref:hypothetical protein n=1 Tax=Haladaptatus caseinilyticus TaxID=2993314 RepID=UPI00224B3A8A|nr:hypothetical protein [Haladaptatus caseinilyticus]
MSVNNRLAFPERRFPKEDATPNRITTNATMRKVTSSEMVGNGGGVGTDDLIR